MTKSRPVFVKLIIFIFSAAILASVIVAFFPVFPKTNLYLRRYQNKFRTLTRGLDWIYHLTALTKKDQLPTYRLYIKSGDVWTMLSNLPSSQDQKLTSQNKIKVPATLSQLNEDIPVEVRIRGELWPHWLNNKKSLKLELSQNSINGYNSLNFILPEERGYIDQAAAIILGDRLGLIVPQFHYAKLQINDVPQGIYFITQDLNNHFLNNQPISGKLSIFAEEQFSLDANLYSLDGKWKIIASTADNPDLQPINKLQQAFANKDDEQFFQDISQSFDIDYFLTWQALSVILGDTHQGNFHNNRLLYNHQTQKFYFIPDDVKIRVPEEIDFGKQYHNQNVLVARVLKNPSWLKKRNLIIKDIINSGKVSQLISDLNQLEASIRPSIFKDQNKYPSSYMYVWDIRYKQQFLTNNLAHLKQQLSTNPDTFY